MRFLIIILLSSFSIQFISAQMLKPIKDPNVLKKYNMVLVKNHPHVFDTLTTLDVYDLGDNYTKAIFSHDGKYLEKLYYNKGNDLMLVAEGERLPPNQYPQIIMDAFKDAHPNKAINHIYLLQHSYDGEKAFAVEYKKSKDLTRIYYNKLGVNIDPPK